ncbi:copper chaperone PCu(A)C [Pyruvatibacter sp.]|uniref:copper chaperone PCu(A)C n=1 Tax=Pyruvatibacter sp. TaxID=1981328 RepID=UPI003263459D
MIRRILFALALSMPLAIAACSDGGPSEISVEEPFARETIGAGTTGAAYLVIRNSGGADRLIAASTEAAVTTELHTHEKDGEIMRMRKVDAIDVPAHDVVTLQPGGKHIMMFEIMEPLKDGGSFPMTLTFEEAGDITVDVTVVATGGSLGGMDHGAMDHSGH